MTDNSQQIPNPLLGIIFDFDGVIVDSEKHWADVENPYLRRHIPSWHDEDYAILVGKSLPEVYALLQSRGLKIAANQYFVDYEEMAQKLYSDLAQPLAPIITLLDWAHERHIACAIASSSKRSWIDLALRTHNLEHFFMSVASAHDPGVAKGKPAPDVYLQAISTMDISSSNLIAIEDSSNGVLAAKAAGLFCIGLRNGDNETQNLDQADMIVQEFTNLLARLEQAE